MLVVYDEQLNAFLREVFIETERSAIASAANTLS